MGQQYQKERIQALEASRKEIESAVNNIYKKNTVYSLLEGLSTYCL